MGGPPGGSKRSEDSKHTEDSDDPNGERQGEGSSQAVWMEMEEVVNGRLVVLDQLDREDHPDWARVDKVGLRPACIRVEFGRDSSVRGPSRGTNQGDRHGARGQCRAYTVPRG
jgi:hypothetical protein